MQPVAPHHLPCPTILTVRVRCSYGAPAYEQLGYLFHCGHAQCGQCESATHAHILHVLHLHALRVLSSLPHPAGCPACGSSRTSSVAHVARGLRLEVWEARRLRAELGMGRCSRRARMTLVSVRSCGDGPCSAPDSRSDYAFTAACDVTESESERFLGSTFRAPDERHQREVTSRS